jgi:hypothetical protein
MPSYRGNIGNLLQHWVLCEVVDCCNSHWARLRFVDAYSMAPLATERATLHWSSELFDHARDRAKRDSIYERTWSGLGHSAFGYPSSAVFLAALWQGQHSMTLCEYDDATVGELRTWKANHERELRCGGVEVAPGDWRQRFEAAVADADPLFLSFDPDMFSCSDASDDGRKMTSSDLARIVRVVPAAGPVVMQLSTYSVNGANTQEKVKAAVIAGLDGAGLQLLAVVKTDEQMMSMVLGRSCADAIVEAITAMPKRFESWLYQLKASLAVSTQPNQRLHSTAAGLQLSPLPRLPRGHRR